MDEWRTVAKPPRRSKRPSASATSSQTVGDVKKFLSTWKTQECTNKLGHDWLQCAFFHKGGVDQRRNPYEIPYLPDEADLTGPEKAYHPLNFHTKFCEAFCRGAKCKYGEYCAFAHDELQQPSKYEEEMKQKLYPTKSRLQIKEFLPEMSEEVVQPPKILRSQLFEEAADSSRRVVCLPLTCLEVKVLQNPKMTLWKQIKDVELESMCQFQLKWNEMDAVTLQIQGPEQNVRDAQLEVERHLRPMRPKYDETKRKGYHARVIELLSNRLKTDGPEPFTDSKNSDLVSLRIDRQKEEVEVWTSPPRQDRSRVAFFVFVSSTSYFKFILEHDAKNYQGRWGADERAGGPRGRVRCRSALDLFALWALANCFLRLSRRRIAGVGGPGWSERGRVRPWVSRAGPHSMSYPMNSFSLGSPVHINPVTSRPRESDWAMMLGTLQRICEQLQVLTDVEQSMGELQAAMGLVQGSLVFQSQVIEQVRTVVCLAPSQTGTAGTESFELGEECSEPSVKQAPSNDPPMLPLVPGQVAQPVQHSAPPGPEGCPSASPRTPGGASSRSVRFQKPQKAASKNPKKFLRKPSPLVMRPALSKHTATVNQLEACVAQDAARRDWDCWDPRDRDEVWTDADSMICAARFWLLFVGILGFRNATAGSVWFALISLPLLAQIVTLVYFTARGQADFHHTGITLCYMVGSTLASWSMRQAEIHLLLGAVRRRAVRMRKQNWVNFWTKQRDAEADEARKIGLSQRLAECLAQANAGVPRQRLDTSLLTSIFFSSAGVSCTAVVYAQLHLVAGMDLAIDSFSIKLVFFHPESPVMTQSALQMAFFLGWLFPPVLLFLYAMMLVKNERRDRDLELFAFWIVK
eukprot:g12333.t1